MVWPDESGIGRSSHAVSLPAGFSGLLGTLVAKAKGKVKRTWHSKVPHSQFSYVSTIKEGNKVPKVHVFFWIAQFCWFLASSGFKCNPKNIRESFPQRFGQNADGNVVWGDWLFGSVSRLLSPWLFLYFYTIKKKKSGFETNHKNWCRNTKWPPSWLLDLTTGL